VAYSTVRDPVKVLKELTGEPDVRALGRWWHRHRKEWHRWCARQAGLDDEETVRTVG